MGPIRRSQKRADKKDEKKEYSVYVYHFPEETQRGHTDWEKKRTTYSKELALKIAQEYYESSNYLRVEIKQKAFCEKYKCHIDKIYKVLECEPETRGFKCFCVLAGGVVIGALLAAAYFLIF